MGANAVTTVPVYTAGEVLTAADLNITNSGIPVFATTTTRDAAFGGTGEKTLAEGQFAYIEATDTTQYYNGSAWQSVGTTAGLTLVATGTVAAAASVTVNTCFTSTYDEYLLVVDVTGSTLAQLYIQMRNAGSTITAANYQWWRMAYGNGGATDNVNTVGTTSWQFGFVNSVTPSVANINLYDPLTSRIANHNAYSTTVNGTDTAMNIICTGFRYTSAQAFDSFVMSVSAGTMTGTVRVYGLTK
jgi:hypothetical protein